MGARLDEVERLVDKLMGVIEKQGNEIGQLKARKPKTSRTSSKPPSTDAPWAKSASKKKPTGRRRGGQPGHKGAQRKPAPPKDVGETKMVKPSHCGSCADPLFGDDPNPWRHQIIDIPPVKPHITEYVLHRLTCAGCGEETKAELPPGVHASNFGPNIAAQVALLTGEYRMCHALEPKIAGSLEAAVALLHQPVGLRAPLLVDGFRKHLSDMGQKRPRTVSTTLLAMTRSSPYSFPLTR